MNNEELVLIRHIQRETLRKLFELASAEYSDFYYNESNNYGAISLRFFTGRGNPFDQYASNEKLSNFSGEIRGNGFYTLNDNAIEMFLDKINEEEP